MALNQKKRNLILQDLEDFMIIYVKSDQREEARLDLDNLLGKVDRLTKEESKEAYADKLLKQNAESMERADKNMKAHMKIGREQNRILKDLVDAVDQK